MNWIILVIAGLFETAFASCLGKAKEATGSEVIVIILKDDPSDLASGYY